MARARPNWVSMFPMAEDDETFGEMVERLRERTGLSQEVVADHLGITDKTYRAWIRGLPVEKEIQLIEKIAPLLNVTVARLVRKRFAISGDTVDSESAVEADDRLSPQQRAAVIEVIRAFLRSDA